MNNECMYMEDMKELAGLLIEYKYRLRNRYYNSNNPDFKKVIEDKIVGVNKVLVDLGFPTPKQNVWRNDERRFTKDNK